MTQPFHGSGLPPLKKRTARTIGKNEYETLAAFRYALRQFLRFSEDAASKIGLTPQQHQALLAIKGFPGREQVTVSELAERLQIQHHSTVGLVQRLSTQGLIYCEPGKEDRRKVYVSLTPKGASTLEKLATAHQKEIRRMGPRMNRILNELLQKGSDSD